MQVTLASKMTEDCWALGTFLLTVEFSVFTTFWTIFTSLGCLGSMGWIADVLPLGTDSVTQHDSSLCFSMCVYANMCVHMSLSAYPHT